MGRSGMSQVVVLAALLLVAGWVVRGTAITAWMDWTGTPMVTGTSSWTLTGKPVRIFTLLARPPQETQWNAPDVAAFHVLVVACADSLTDGKGSNASNGISATWNHVWSAWSGEPGRERAVQRALTTRYSGVSRTLRVGSERYSLKAGNLFLVRYDERGRMSVRQLPQTVLDPDSYHAMTTFKTLLPTDAAVQNIERWGEKPPCLRQPAIVPRGAST